MYKSFAIVMLLGAINASLTQLNIDESMLKNIEAKEVPTSLAMTKDATPDTDDEEAEG